MKKPRLMFALLIALAFAVAAPCMAAAPNPAPAPMKVYTAPALPVPSIVSGDISITFPGLEEGISAAFRDLATLTVRQRSLERLLAFVLVFTAIPTAFLVYLLVSEFVSRRKTVRPDGTSKPAAARTRQPPAVKAKKPKRTAAKPKAPAAAQPSGS